MQKTVETATWVYVVGSLIARPVKIGTTGDLAGRVRDLQAGSPVPLHVMWQTRGGRTLERSLHQRFATYRKYGEWFDFGEDHPVAIIATAAVGLGHREFPRDDLAASDHLPTHPEVAAARRLAKSLRDAFARASDPELMPVADLVEYLRETDPTVWKQWDGGPQPLAMAGRMIAKTFRAAGFDIAQVRTTTYPGRPSAYRLDQVVKAAL